jgi:hypothetical protein
MKCFLATNPGPKDPGYYFIKHSHLLIACAFSACGIGEATSKAGFHWVSWWNLPTNSLSINRFNGFPYLAITP